jgi:hypothetical protein
MTILHDLSHEPLASSMRVYGLFGVFTTPTQRARLHVMRDGETKGDRCK